MNLRRDFSKIPQAFAFAGALTLTAPPSFAQRVTVLNVSRRTCQRFVELSVPA
jgi:hypothetical protein